jgi:hypothetical protein
MLLVLVAVAVCVAVGFTVGSALAHGNVPGANAPYSAPAAYVSTPDGTTQAGGALAPNGVSDGSANVTNGTIEVPEVDVAGTVNQIDTAQSILILATPQGNVTVSITNQTEFGDNLNSLADARPGMELEVTGVQQSNGQVIADSIDESSAQPPTSND